MFFFSFSSLPKLRIFTISLKGSIFWQIWITDNCGLARWANWGKEREGYLNVECCGITTAGRMREPLSSRTRGACWSWVRRSNTEKEVTTLHGTERCTVHTWRHTNCLFLELSIFCERWLTAGDGKHVRGDDWTLKSVWIPDEIGLQRYIPLESTRKVNT